MNDDFNPYVSADSINTQVGHHQMVSDRNANNLGAGNLGSGVLPQDNPAENKSLNHPDGIPELSNDNSSSLLSDVRLGTKSSSEMKNIDSHLGQKSDSTISKVQNPLHNSINDTTNDAFGLNQVNASLLQREPAQRFDERRSEESTAGSTFDSQQSEFKEQVKAEEENLKTLLKDLYAGFNKKDVLSDQMENEPFLLKKFFNKYSPSKTDFLAVMLAGLYLALDNLEGAKAKLARIRDPNNTDDSNENAGYHRAYYIMQANLKMEENQFVEARKLLKQAYNIPQTFFTDGKESFLDFYSTSMGRVNLMEGKLKEAEECFKDALAQRLLSKNSRLISSSYNDLALLYIEKRRAKAEALQYLNKVREYDGIFQQELKSNRYNVLSGQVDYKRPEIAKTEEAHRLLMSS